MKVLGCLTCSNGDLPSTVITAALVSDEMDCQVDATNVSHS